MEGEKEIDIEEHPKMTKKELAVFLGTWYYLFWLGYKAIEGSLERFILLMGVKYNVGDYGSLIVLGGYAKKYLLYDVLFEATVVICLSYVVAKRINQL